MLTKKILNIIFPLLVVLVIAIVLIHERVERTRMDEDHSYTIATVYNIRFQGKLGNGIYYKYKVNGRDYYDSYTSRLEREDLKKLVGKRFYLKFYSKKPKTNEILFKERVPTTIENPPKNGWVQIPR